MNSAELELAQELVEVLRRMGEVKDELEKIVTEHQTLETRRQEILTSLNDGAGEKRPRAKRSKKAEETHETNPEPAPLPKPANSENDEFDQMDLGELSDLADKYQIPDSGKMNADKLRAALREALKVTVPTTYEQFNAVISGKPVPITPNTVAAALPEPESLSEAVKGNLKALKEAEGKPAPEVKLTPDQEAAQAEALALYDAGVEKRSDAQMRMIYALLGNHDIRDEASQKDVIWGVIAEQHHGEALNSTKDLSKVWATGLIDFLNKAKPGQLDKYLKEPFYK